MGAVGIGSVLGLRPGLRRVIHSPLGCWVVFYNNVPDIFASILAYVIDGAGEPMIGRGPASEEGDR